MKEEIIEVATMKQFYDAITDSRFNIYRGMPKAPFEILSSEHVLFNNNSVSDIQIEDNVEKYKVYIRDNLLFNLGVLSENIDVLLKENCEKREFVKFLDSMEILQHYGYPTQFVDWSNNWKIALYFAVESYEKEDMVIWCLNKNEIPFLEDAVNDSNYLNLDFRDEMFEGNQIIRLFENLESGIYLCEYPFFNRIYRQEGVLLYAPFFEDISFEKQMKDCPWIHSVKKIIIKKTLYGEIIKYLKSENITKESLFCDKEYPECTDKKDYLKLFPEVDFGV